MQYEFGGFRLDPDSARLLGPKGVVVDLQPQPFEVLRVLVEARGRLVSHGELRQAVWGERAVEYDQSIYYCIRQIRMALGDTASEIVKTVPRRGYRIDVDVVCRRGGRAPLRWAVAATAGALVAITPSLNNPPQKRQHAPHSAAAMDTFRLAQARLAGDVDRDDMRAAVSYLESSLRLEPGLDRARALLAGLTLSLYERGENTGLITTVQEWIENAPDDRRWLLPRAHRAFLEGDGELAVLLLRSLHEDEASATELALFGRLFEAQSEPDSALKYFRMGLWRSGAGSHDLALNVGRSYLGRGDIDNAARFVDLALEIRPNSEEAARVRQQVAHGRNLLSR